MGRVEFIPQAIVNAPLDIFARRFKAPTESGHDELDNYEGIGFVLNNVCEFALMHYEGYPEQTATIYLSSKVHDLDQITDLVRKISQALDIPPSAIEWQRKDNPDL
jgi:hypothetical protein